MNIDAGVKKKPSISGQPCRAPIRTPRHAPNQPHSQEAADTMPLYAMHTTHKLSPRYALGVALMDVTSADAISDCGHVACVDSVPYDWYLAVRCP